MVLGKLKPERSCESRNITHPDGHPETSPPPATPTAPRAINHLKRHVLQMVARNTPSSNKLKVFIDQLGRAAEGAAAEKDLSAGMLKDLRSKAQDLCSAAARDRRQLSKARVIDSEDVVHLRDKREMVDSKKAARAAAWAEKKKQGTAKKPAAKTRTKGKGVEVISLEEELEEFCLSEGDGYETVDEEVGDTSGLEGRRTIHL